MDTSSWKSFVKRLVEFLQETSKQRAINKTVPVGAANGNLSSSFSSCEDIKPLIELPPTPKNFTVTSNFQAKTTADYILKHHPSEVKISVSGHELSGQPSPSSIEAILSNAERPVSMSLFFMDSYNGIKISDDNEEDLMSLCLDHAK